MTADQVAARTGARQHGLLTLGQARAAGLTDRQVRSRVAAGRLTPVRPRVYRFAGVRPSWEAEVLAAVLSAGSRAVASHATAAALLGVGRVESCGRIEVTVLRSGNPRGLGGVLVHRTVTLDPADVCGVRGVPCTSAARTVVDLAARLGPDPLRSLVDDALFDELATRTGLHRRAVALAPGRGGVEIVADLTRPGAEEAFRSWLEREAARVFGAAGVPPPRWNQSIADRHGTVGVVDAQWPEARLVVELDGLRFHRWRAAAPRGPRERPSPRACGAPRVALHLVRRADPARDGGGAGARGARAVSRGPSLAGMGMGMRDIDPVGLAGRGAYRLLTSLVVPRPIAWVSTLAEDGTRNLAPHSYFNAISGAPPVVHFTSAGTKDTLRNVRASGEFVVNVVSRELVEQMNFTAADFPPGEDEFTWAGLASAPSRLVAPPRVARARAALECRVHSEVTIGEGTMVFGEVVSFAVAEELLVDGTADPRRLDSVGRLGGTGYTGTRDVFELARPAWDDVRGRD